jgi:diketogulonate reductase-like aldo/keto reductase
VRPSCEETLRCLGLEYLDLFLVHFPLAFKDCGVKSGSPGWELDSEGVCKMEQAPLHKTWGAMEELVDAGLVRSIGVSNFEFLTFNDCLGYARIPPAVNQIEAHPYFACDWFIKYCHRNGVHVTCHTPLGGADANDKWRGDPTSPLDDPVIAAIAAKHAKSPAQVCLRWGLQRGTSVIPKSTKPHRIRENFAVFDFRLAADEVAAITAIDKKQRSNKSGAAWGIQFKA